MIAGKNISTYSFLFGLLFFIDLVSGMQLCAQSRVGITNKPDTSYTNYSAYNYEKPHHPDIKLVTGFNYSDVIVKKNITYCTIGNRKLVLDAFTPKQSS